MCKITLGKKNNRSVAPPHFVLVKVLNQVDTHSHTTVCWLHDQYLTLSLTPHGQIHVHQTFLPIYSIISQRGDSVQSFGSQFIVSVLIDIDHLFCKPKWESFQRVVIEYRLIIYRIQLPNIIVYFFLCTDLRIHVWCTVHSSHCKIKASKQQLCKFWCTLNSFL